VIPRTRDTKIAAWVLTAPLLLFFALMLAYPLVVGLRTAFSRNRLSDPVVSWSGLENFISIATNKTFWDSISFTLQFAFIATALQLVLGFLLALVFDRKIPGKAALFSAILVPIMIAPSLMAVMYRLLLNENIGAVPAVLSVFGIQVSLFNPGSVFALLIVLDCIQFIPFTFLLFYASLQNIPDELYEAASIDGARYAGTIWRIVVPILKPAIVVIVLLRVLESIRNFDVIYILTGGGPGTITQTVGIFIYKTAFQQGDFGAASAASVILVLLLAPFTPWIIKKLSTSEKQ
jgi:multiple sugar transport system permease protein